MQVFLVSGQKITSKDSGDESVSALIEQQIVVAVDKQAAYEALAEKKPDFRPVGITSLDEYESIVAKMKATLRGVDTGLELLISPRVVT